ncbi:PAB-dependent pol [Sesbania bispinosa]|nr:PAB-dependent pol [Sesbania bispinosa]
MASCLRIERERNSGQFYSLVAVQVNFEQPQPPPSMTLEPGSVLPSSTKRPA